MGHMFLLICVSHKMLCARHHVWPETRTMLGTSLCLLSACCPLRVRNCKDVQGQVGASCCPLWPCHSQTALIHFWPVCLPTASSTHGHSFKRAVHLLLHLLLLSSFATVSNNSQGHSLFLCHTPTSVNPLWQQSFWFSHLILPWQNYYANGADSWGDGVGWEHPQG